MDRIKVLLVDDETAFSGVLARRLEKRGLGVRTASCASEALEALRLEEMDVVLLDVKMPGRDGVRLLGEIKRLYPQVAVLMLTAHINPDIFISCLAMGARDYLLKPVDAAELAEKIRDAAGLGKNIPDGMN
ncbi:response regulator [Maridesulfovibrio sp.]|uniref:response regulator n=1 Tax=Maridesulfovibrio sp. TaxID=2795000 RepID=UPI002A186B3B|nr:response regulator [Maridesulfovibrio sp.]